MLRYAIIIEKAKDGGYGAYVPDLPGCSALACVPQVSNKLASCRHLPEATNKNSLQDASYSR